MNEYISKHEPIEEIQRIYCTGCNSCNGVMCRSCEHQYDDMVWLNGKCTCPSCYIKRRAQLDAQREDNHAE